MKNAGIEELLYLNINNVPKDNVMYTCHHPWLGQLLCHYKARVVYCAQRMFVMETPEGHQLLSEQKWLGSVHKKQGSKPKIKKEHVKGLLPHLGYQAHRIKHGVKVRLRNGDDWYVTTNGNPVYGGVQSYSTEFFDVTTGKHHNSRDYDIVRILDSYEPKQEMEATEGFVKYNSSLAEVGCEVICRDGSKQQILSIEIPVIRLLNRNTVFTKTGTVWRDSPITEDSTDIMLIKPLTKADNAYNGYAPAIWHFWQGQSSTPPVGCDVVVQTHFRSDMQPRSQAARAFSLRWDWIEGSRNGDIIAFKIIS